MNGSSSDLLKDAVARIEVALVQKAEIDETKRVIDEEVEALTDAVRALHRVYGGTLPESVTKHLEGDLGITDQVRGVMKAQGNNYLLPMQVRQQVEARGFNMAGYSNPMAVIHQVLKRLERQGELSIHPGGQHYKWNA